MLSKSATFSDFQLSQGSVATCCRSGGNLWGVYIEDFPANHYGERILKIGPQLPKLLSNINEKNFLRQCII